MSLTPCECVSWTRVERVVFCRNYRDVFGRARGERVLQFPSYSFDVSVMNIWDAFAVSLCSSHPWSLHPRKIELILCMSTLRTARFNPLSDDSLLPILRSRRLDPSSRLYSRRPDSDYLLPSFRTCRSSTTRRRNCQTSLGERWIPDQTGQYRWRES